MWKQRVEFYCYIHCHQIKSVSKPPTNTTFKSLSEKHACFFFLLILFICYFLKFVILWDYNFSPRTYSVILFLCCLYEWSHFCTALFSFLFVGVSSNSIRDFLFLFLWSCLIYMCVCVFKTSKNVVKKNGKEW